MIMRIAKLGLLIGVILLTSCIGEKEEDIKVTLNYQHENKKQKEYPEANFNNVPRYTTGSDHEYMKVSTVVSLSIVTLSIVSSSTIWLG